MRVVPRMEEIRALVHRCVGVPARARRTSAARSALALVLCLVLAACTVVRPTPVATTTSAAPGATAAPSATVAVQPSLTGTSAPSAIAPSPTGVPAPTAPSTVTPGSATPSAADAAAIKAVIQRGNDEEVQAVAANDPTVMRDTATATYYQQLQQDLSDLTNADATAIALVKVVWGPIALTGPSAARATTHETWSTTFSDGGTVVGTDLNLYTLVKDAGAWKIQTDDQPGSRSAQPSPGTATAPTPAPAVTPVSADQSSNWAGYAATGGSFTSVTGSWTVPTVGAVSTSAGDATWVGIGGSNTNDLIQAGTEATVESGQVTYDAWLELLPRSEQVVPLNVSAGDAVRVTITEAAGGTWQILMEDFTASYTYQIKVSYASSHSSAEWIEEAPAVGRRRQEPLDAFGVVHFTAATTVENGQRRTIKQAGGQPIALYGRGPQPLAQPSTLGADGASFTVVRTGAQ